MLGAKKPADTEKIGKPSFLGQRSGLPTALDTIVTLDASAARSIVGGTFRLLLPVIHLANFCAARMQGSSMNAVTASATAQTIAR